MNDVIQIPVKEYEAMKETITLLKDGDLIQKMTRLIELVYEEKYGLYMGDSTTDLTDASIKKSWPESNSTWDHV